VQRSGGLFQPVAANQDVRRQLQTRCEPSDHLQREGADAVQHFGDARARAACTSRTSPAPSRRSSTTAAPDIPTADEAGLKGFESAAWFGFLAPRGTPRPPVDRRNKEIAAAIADPAVRSRFSDFGAEPLASTPEELGRYIAAEVVKWRAIITKGEIALE
jgi:tripartite-type tricarboxylate transporter receptor subunit TctC